VRLNAETMLEIGQLGETLGNLATNVWSALTMGEICNADGTVCITAYRISSAPKRNAMKRPADD
jgi:hypothetical protein